MIIDFELLKGFDRTLDDALFKGLALGEDRIRQRCAAFLEEDTKIVRRRESLTLDLERFGAALDDLQNIAAVEAVHGYDTEDGAGSLPLESDGATVFPESVPIREMKSGAPPVELDRPSSSAPAPTPASVVSFAASLPQGLSPVSAVKSSASSAFSFAAPQAPAPSAFSFTSTQAPVSSNSSIFGTAAQAPVSFGSNLFGTSPSVYESPSSKKKGGRY